MSKQVLMIDSQLLNIFQECPAKFYYNFILNVRPLFKPEAFDKGDLLHHMLKFHYKQIKHNQLCQANNLSADGVKIIPYNEITKTCIKKAEKHLLKLDLDVGLGQEIIKVYEQYAEYYKNESWQILEVEKPFAKVIFEDETLKIVYVGIIDLLTHVAIVDHKSSSRRGQTSGLSNQFMGYAWAFNLHNVVINKVGLQKTLKPEEKFERPTKSYPAAIIEEWKNNTINVAKTMFVYINNIPDMMNKRNYTSCDKYSGCIFQEVCETTPEAREFKISQKYQIGESWRPVKGLEV
jgi:hypothetical protein